MAVPTVFLLLLKAARGERYSVAVTNSNLDLIDAGVKAVADDLTKPRIAYYTMIAVKAMTANTATPMGPLEPSASRVDQTQNNTFSKVKNTGATLGQIELTEDGDYDFFYQFLPSTTPVNIALTMVVADNAGTNPQKIATLSTTGNFGETSRTISGKYYCKAGQIVSVDATSSIAMSLACGISVRKVK